MWSVGQIHARGRRRHLALGLEQARLEVDDVVAQLVVLCLQTLVHLAQVLELLDLVFELLDVFLFALAECALLVVRGSGFTYVHVLANVLERLDSELRACWSTALYVPCALRRHPRA